MLFKIALVVLSGLLCIHRVEAQRQLALLKGDKIITKYGEGEYIRFQRKGEDGFIHAIITGIHPGYFMLGSDSVFTYEVDRIDIRKKSQRNYKASLIGSRIIQAGVLLLVADVFNAIVIRDINYRWNDASNASLIMIGVGGLLQFVNNDNFKLSHRRKLATLNLQ
ncbi:MAG TPA: hypothetical protein VIS49_08950 [Cyclobacteriaceae bacterium]